MTEHALDPIFNPRAVAVVGVRSNPGTGMMGSFYDSLLEAGFENVYPVNPKATEINGARCYPTLLDTPDPVDHVISQVPAAVVPALVDQCVEKQVRSIHFFTAGFSETGDAVLAETEHEMIAKLKRAGIRAIGPNCMGLYVPASRLAFMSGFPMEPGNVFLLSQSGANAGEIIHGLVTRGVRFSKAVSYGNGADLRAHDFLDYAAADPETEVVAAYIEGVQDGRRFFDALRRCAAVKPVIMLKGGRTQSGSNAAFSHTGSLAGSIEVFDAACRQAGALRAETMDELHDLVVGVSTSTRRAEGRGVALFGGGGGGFAVLSSDAIDREGLTVPRMPQSAIDEMREYIPVAGSSVNNPIDAFPPEEHLDDMLRLIATADGMDMLFMSPMTGWRRPPPGSKDAKATDTGAGKGTDTGADKGADKGADPTPDPAAVQQEMADNAAKAAEQMAKLEADTGTPVVGILRSGRMARMMGQSRSVMSEAAFRQGIGMYPSVARAARTVAQILEWKAYSDGIVADPAPSVDVDPPEPGTHEAHRLLNEVDAKQRLHAAGVPVTRTVLTKTVEEAREAAADAGYPVVLKIVSPDIAHKSDVGGVKVGLADADAVAAAYDEIIASARQAVPNAAIDGIAVQHMAPAGTEVIVGMTTDPQFGPVVMFGLGGVLVEVLRDVAFRVVPLSERDADQMIDEIRGKAILDGVRGQPALDRAAIREALLKVSAFVIDNPEVREIDLNPMLVYPDGAIAVDARIVIAE